MGNLLVLEAVMVAIMMMGAIAYVSTIEPPRGNPNVVVDQLNLRASDFLRTADGVPLSGSCQGKTRLTDLVIKGINGNHSTWRDRVRSFFGDGIAAGLTLSNGHGNLLVHGTEVENGAGRALTIMPDFDFARAEAVSPTSESGIVTAESWAVRQGELVRMRGEAVEFAVTSSEASGSQILRAWGTVGLLSNGAADRDRHASSVAWVGTTGTTKALRTSPDPLMITQGLRLRLHIEPPDGDLPSNQSIGAGTTLTMTWPRGWTGITDPGEPWVPVAYSNASSLTATYRHNVSSLGPTTLEFHATPPSNPTHPFDFIHARLGNGSVGESTLVVQYPAPVDRDLPRQVFATTPYPLRPGGSAFFGVAFGNGGAGTTVTDFTISIPGGYDIWANRGQGAALFDPEGVILNAFPPADEETGSSWSIDPDGKHVRWHGSVFVPALGAEWWGAELPITHDASQATSIEPVGGTGPSARLSFPSGFTDVSTAWGRSPGVIRSRVPPDEGGSEPSGYPDDSTTFNATIVGPRSALRANGSYSATPTGGVLGLDSAVTNASFRVASRLAPLGSIMRADADFRSLTTKLASLGIVATTVTMELWAPGGDGCSPTKRWSVESSSMPGADISDMKTWGALPTGKSVFVASSDGFVSRLNPLTGAAAWRSAVVAPKHLAFVGSTETDPNAAVLVTAGESVIALSPLSGEPIWSSCVAEASCGLGAEGARLIASDSTSRAAVTTTGGRLVMLDATNGDLIHSVSATSVAANFTQIAFAPDGSLLSLDESGHLSRWSSNLELLASATMEGMVGFAPSGTRVLLGVETEVLTLNLADLAIISRSNMDGRVLMVGAGDADGDGAGDIVVGLGGAQLIVLFGDGDAALFDPTTTPSPAVKSLSWLFASPHDDLTEQCAGGGDVYVGVADGQEYANEAACVLSGLEASVPLSIEVGPDGVLYGYQHRGRNLALIHPDGSVGWHRSYPEGRVATAHARGPWLAEPNAVLVAYNDGLFEAREPTTGAVAWSQRVSDFVGTFSIYLGVPSGSFFGSHVLVADLSWVDEAAQTQHARLTDWYEVVSRDGTPVLTPAYQVELRVADFSYR